jgi:hypothetical protein
MKSIVISLCKLPQKPNYSKMLVHKKWDYLTKGDPTFKIIG